MRYLVNIGTLCEEEDLGQAVLDAINDVVSADTLDLQVFDLATGQVHAVAFDMKKVREDAATPAVPEAPAEITWTEPKAPTVPPYAGSRRLH